MSQLFLERKTNQGVDLKVFIVKHLQVEFLLVLVLNHV